jgi:hypothetical protein
MFRYLNLISVNYYQAPSKPGILTIVKPPYTLDMERKQYEIYRPFDSDIESDSETIIASEESLQNTAGPNFADFARHLIYEKQEEYAEYIPGPKEPPKQATPKTKEITSLFLIDSKNRDKSAFPQPTSFTLKPPRVYKNIVSIQVTQIKFLSSFLYFRKEKGNIILPLIETGRIRINSYLGYELTSAVNIRQGTYTINELLTEIQTQMNVTPLFYDFPETVNSDGTVVTSFAGFVNNFTTNGDLSVNFNQPGDTYYDRLNSKFIANPTVASITAYYWGSRYAGLLEYSIDQVKLAYYYPVLYEAVLDITETRIKLDLTIPQNLLLGGETPYSHIIFNCSGLNDVAILYLVNQNIAALDSYRLYNTFRYYAVNRYQLAYDTNTLRVNILSVSLNTSLVNLINQVSARDLATILDTIGIIPVNYTNLNTILNRARVVYTDMYNFIQNQLTTYFAIPYAKYASQYFNDITNTLYIQNGLNATGIRKGYTTEYLTSGETPISSMVVSYSNSPGYWPNFNVENTENGILGGGYNDLDINPLESMIPYNVLGKNFQFGTRTIDLDTHLIQTNKATRSVDVIATINPGKYTVFKFKSSARQTLQVETLPLPFYYRFADYNKQGLYKGVLDSEKNNVPQQYFDISYSYVYDTTTVFMDNSNYSTIKLQNIFGQSLTTTFDLSPLIPMNSQNNYFQFEFNTPYPADISSGLVRYNTNISFISMLTNTVSTLYVDKFNAFLYHDRAAFMADIQNIRNENPLHYIASQTVDTTSSDLTFNLSTFAGHTYYTIFRSVSTAFSNIQMKPLVYYSDTTYNEVKTDYVNFDPNANPNDASNANNYPFVVNYNTDFLRLPMRSTLQGIDPSNSTFKTAVTIGGYPIGYDISGVSNNLTDYMGYSLTTPGFIPNTKYRIDPLSYYVFQKSSPFDFNKNTYFASTSQNKLLVPVTNNPYTFKGTSSVQLKIAHWYDGYSIPRQSDDAFTTFQTISTATRSSITPYLPGYPTNSNGDIKFGRGINAIGFTPTDGLYEIDSFTFKSVIYPTSSSNVTQEDPNLQVAYIGVFSGLYLSGNIINFTDALTVLKFNKAVPYCPSTLSNTPGFGSDFGTWYEYLYDPSFVASSNVNINGYTPGSNDLLSYNSMYYMVPFNSQMSNVTFSGLTGSLLPYPLYQTISTGSTYFGQKTLNIIGTQAQPVYIMPSTIGGADPQYGPQSGISLNQSQYEQSMAITTPSIGYKEYGYLVTNTNTLFPFTTQFINSVGIIPTGSMGLTTYVSEYSNSLYLINSLSNVANISNVGHSFPGASYASSISSFIGSTTLGTGALSSITYLLSTPSTLQNYTFSGNINYYSTFLFKAMSGNDSNVTTERFELNESMGNITLWLWGGGGSTWLNTSSISGGAGAYIKAQVNAQTLLNTFTLPDCQAGISTLYIVVGKGGNRDNIPFIPTTGVFHGYEQPRYGGGGTSIIENPSGSDNVALQGGGFTGIFTGSNLLTATPLLIVGGGGAAGAYTYGGPGGIGIEPLALPIVAFTFSSVVTNAIFYGQQFINTIEDIDFNSKINGLSVLNSIDSAVTTYWDPRATPYLNPNNYSPTPNTYRVNLFYGTSTDLLKLRYYGPAYDDPLHLPTGFVVYTSEDKTQMLYSNTTISPSDYQIIDNGRFKQNIYEMMPFSIPHTNLNTNAWIVGGSNTSVINKLQYSINGINWTSITTDTSAVTNIKSIQYIPLFNSWYACGTGGIIKSTDGLNWTQALVAGGTIFTSIAYGSTVNNTIIAIAGVDNGDSYTTTNGTNWEKNSIKIFTNSLSKMRYINGSFWATGYTDIAGTTLDTVLKTSADGISWTTNTLSGSATVNDIAYGAGQYVVAQLNTSDPYRSGLLYSISGTTWSAVSQTNLSGFSANSVVYGNTIFVAAGSTTDGTSFIKYSADGINWRNSSIPATADLGRVEIQYVGGKFVCVGKSAKATGKAGNQPSILTSTDGITWSYIVTGGFNSDIGDAYANTVAYGPVTIIPRLTGIYIEIQKTTNIAYEPFVYEFRAYNTSKFLTTTTLNTINKIYDSDYTTMFQPTQQEVDGILQYPFTFTFSNQTTVNKIEIYTMLTIDSLFTGIQIQTGATDQSIIYKNMEITPGDFITRNGKNMLQIIISPPINTISFSITFTKLNPGVLTIYEVVASYDNNIALVQYIPTTLKDLDTRGSATPSQLLANITDGDLLTNWVPNIYTIGSRVRINFQFPAVVPKINNVHLYNGLYGTTSDLISGIYIYTDSNKGQILYSNDSPISRNYSNYNLFDLPIESYGSLGNIYIEIAKNTPGVPLINELKFFNAGTMVFTSTVTGYAGGALDVMQKSTRGFSPTDGGGGGKSVQGVAGIKGFGGGYLTGGSPAETGNYLSVSSFTGIQNGAGGGGGGYYGGGGGGIIGTFGGAGGGGAGYIYNGLNLITVLDYATAYPSYNHLSPGTQEHDILLYNNILPPVSDLYSQGGLVTVDSGRGQHGVIVVSYESNVIVIPPNNSTATPHYIDGSKLSLFQSPITYNTDNRSLTFTTYNDSIETTSNAGYNWVWYRSYLLLTGNTLLSTMKASSLSASSPAIEFPNLPSEVYTILATQFSNVSTFYGPGRNNITTNDLITNTSIIAETIANAFNTFQSNFVNVSYGNSKYIEMTEIYCLLDYLKNISNLLTPHINPLGSSMDRIFGGVPRFGYWANPFLTNVSYVGFDVGPSLFAPSELQFISGNSNPVQAFYGLVLEQSLSTGLYQMKDIMAYKPTPLDLVTYGSNWAKVTQFTESYHIRNLTDRQHLTSNIPVQPYSVRNGINGQIPLFNYKVYTTPVTFGTTTINSPIHMINDFEGSDAYFYSFQNTRINNTSSINIATKSFTSTIIQLNQAIITQQANTATGIMGTIVTESDDSTTVNAVTQFGYNATNTTNFMPVINYSSDFYNTYTSDSELSAVNVGKAITDSYGNFYAANNSGGTHLYENICTVKIFQKSFANRNIAYASPKHLAANYASGTINPYYDFLVSKTSNIWHIQGTSQVSTIYGARLSSPYDFNITTNFANQVFYPTHKITLTKKGTSVNPITDITDVTTYPSYPHTEMFFYKNYSTLQSDIQGKFALENTSNFAYTDMLSGYFFDSYIHNIILDKSDINSISDDSFNYLAIRAYSPSESFKTMLRLYLPERYDFGYISLKDLSGELHVLNTQTNVNPSYKNILSSFNNAFSTTRIFGSTGLPGFSGSNISSINFGDFLNQYNKINTTINSSSYITSTVNGYVTQGQSNLITGDLRYIVPSYLANRQRITDPLEFKIPFSTIISSSNRGIEEYGLGYNLGFDPVDTEFNTIHRATSFFKILDDYIYLRMNPEFNMNRLDISQQENFAETHDTTAQGQLYNCKLILNNFGTYATTFVQNPVNFNPTIGKLDKLSFAWYDITGILINNVECEWSGAIQVVEKVDVA